MNPQQPQQQPKQPKAYRIIMRSQSEEDRAAETEEKGYVNSLPARDATVIDADHMAPLTDEIYIVGIGPGSFPVRRAHHRCPRPHADFYTISTTYKEGIPSDRPNDPSHSDWLVTPKFHKILTMHVKNIATINGKPVMYVGNTDSGASQLGQFDEGWTIEGVSDLLEE